MKHTLGFTKVPVVDTVERLLAERKLPPVSYQQEEHRPQTFDYIALAKTVSLKEDNCACVPATQLPSPIEGAATFVLAMWPLHSGGVDSAGTMLVRT